VNLLGEIFWGYVHRVVTKLSSKFHRIWTSFAQDLTFDLTFEALVSGCLEGTGLTGNRSDQSGFLNSNPTGLTNRSNWSLQASSAFRLALLPCCDLCLLLRDNLFIAILADLGSRVCGDFGT